jgi:peptide-methionine (S)-S-oxide reductase
MTGKTMSIRKGFRMMLLSFIAVAAVVAGSDSMGKMTETTTGTFERATFVGICFWCMESPFDKLPGVVSVTSGYTGGTVRNPTYKQVSAGGTGHAEAVQIVYDPTRTGYGKLLEVFWHNTDPTAIDRQFCDVGSQYRSGIFYHSEGQRLLALGSKEGLEMSKSFKGPIVTEVAKAGEFYPAEEYHQHCYKKNPIP